MAVRWITTDPRWSLFEDEDGSSKLNPYAGFFKPIFLLWICDMCASGPCSFLPASLYQTLPYHSSLYYLIQFQDSSVIRFLLSFFVVDYWMRQAEKGCGRHVLECVHESNHRTILSDYHLGHFLLHFNSYFQNFCNDQKVKHYCGVLYSYICFWKLLGSKKS